MKHAYLIIAHNEPELFGVLISLLDDARNDIYVMIDQKVDIAPFKKYSTRQSKLIFLENRIKNSWGAYSLVQTELALFSKAYESGERYSYYHLLSGVDLPIKTQDEIHAFFQQKRSDDGMPLEFISFWEGEKHERDLRYKMGYHIPLKKYFRAKGAVGWVFDRIRRVCYEAQRLVGYRKKYPGVTFKKGDNWVSLSDRGVGYLLERRDVIRRIFKGSICPDEIYKQTLLYRSPLRKYIYSPKNSGEACVRAIDWERGRPYTWSAGDFSELKSLPQFFARKFTMSTAEGRTLVEEIRKMLSP